ncbi:hypothetical protein HPB50_003434 [Hyalomma asiaticum]|uniref:Uncharacterized protein n=1 Tax=Hyalomma asiaticum TaxID=266040 RepID=A0ACB7RIU5_HYAAI|nr:hypothetical protein HPB50_003434 [Hyalomma asiaticum]
MTKIKPKKHRAKIVAALHAKRVDVLTDNCAPDKIQDLTHEAAVQKLAEYVAPKGNEIEQPRRFLARKLTGRRVDRQCDCRDGGTQRILETVEGPSDQGVHALRTIRPPQKTVARLDGTVKQREPHLLLLPRQGLPQNGRMQPRQDNVVSCEAPSSDMEDFGQLFFHLPEKSADRVRVSYELKVHIWSPPSAATCPADATHCCLSTVLEKSSF